MKFRRTAIALGVGAATAAGLSLLKVEKPVVIGSTVAAVATSLIVAKRKSETIKKSTEIAENAGTQKIAINTFKKKDKDLSADIHNNRGNYYFKRGDYKDAINSFNKAIEVAMRFDNHAYKNGLKNEQNRQWKNAIFDFQRSERFVRFILKNAYFYRGFSKKYCGDFQGSVLDFKHYIDILYEPEIYNGL